LVRIYTLMSDLRVPLEEKLWAMFSIVKITKTSSVLNKGVVMTWCHSSFAFQPLKATWWTLQNPQVQGISFILASYLLKSYFIVTFTFARGWAKNTCGGACWWSLTLKFKCQTLHKFFLVEHQTYIRIYN
jgi:hypothetical protein